MLVDFSERLKRLRREKGYSQAALAQKVSDMGQNLSEAALAKYESSRTYPNLQVAASLADYFGVSIDYLARSLQQQNKNHRVTPKSTPTPEQQELVFKVIEQFLK